jgi:hypothetical protein
MDKVRKIPVFILVVLLIISAFTGCGKAAGESIADINKPAAGADQNKTFNDENTSPTFAEYDGVSTGNGISGEKMIYLARISIETLEFDKTLKDIEDYVLSLGGFVENSSISGLGEKYNGTSSMNLGYAEIVYRIPENQYTGFLNNIKVYGNVISQSSSSQNITSNYYDTDGRLKAYRTAEERLLEILAKADAVTDMLEIEKELTNLRANIEGLTSQLKAWDSLVDYSTITISVQEVEKITDTSKDDSFGKKLLKTIEKSFYGFLAFIKGVIIVVVYIIPYAIILIVILLIIFRGRSFFIRKPK